MIFQFAPKKKEQHTQNEKGEPEPQTRLCADVINKAELKKQK